MYNYIEMAYKKYTDDIYIPIKELKLKALPFLHKVIEYREQFSEVIKTKDGFATIVETPTLIKNRLLKNIEIKGLIDYDFKTNDYILELSLDLINGKDIKLKNKNQIITQFKQNNNDLTLVTEFIIQNIDQLIISRTEISMIGRALPELSSKDIEFIKRSHNPNHIYTLEDYKSINNVVYETARKALERLSNIGLYKQEKIRKKFIYKPTQKLLLHMKGSA